ncbi:hypothetical protein EDB92DRAFT_1875786 [Lactarius akahatsu]|uniref:F-box domain-containing protein n=1 Tax=Lactarius akahatsu TaxID=416441 RepID=A0AAD4LGB8_9AGAM|nr:hypothetical protein EDB92DRAFT_1875786 [Lactarius akahatsu]
MLSPFFFLIKMSSPFPPEILCEIALHLPLTEDVISLTLTNHAVRVALSTPALFKARLLSQKWDIDAWQDEDDKAQRLGDWKRWIRIDHVHSRTLQLFEEASAGGLSPPLVEAPSESRPPNPDVRNVRDTRIHFGKTEDWSRRLSIVFPMLISHHRANNILRITETKYCDAFRAHLMVVTESCHPPFQQSREIRDRSLSTFCWLERACFGLVAFVIQCNADTIESIFGSAWATDGSPDFAKAPTDIVDISRRYSAGFLIQLKMCLNLHFQATHEPLSLLPPSLPPMDPASQYDEPYELGSPTFVWPWLRDGLAGTPLTGLSSASGQKWVGYYIDEGMDEPPMFFELYLAPPHAADAGGNKLYFRGDGADSVGFFTLEGSSDMQTGVVIARKTYVGAHWWDWRGVITPFGMVGVWGTEAQNLGWWWVWPQEWSERSPAPPTVTVE